MNLNLLGFDESPINGVWIYNKRWRQCYNSLSYTISKLTRTMNWWADESGGYRGFTNGVSQSHKWHQDSLHDEWILIGCEGESTEFCSSITYPNYARSINDYRDKTVNLSTPYQPPPYSIILFDNRIVYHRTPENCKSRMMYRYSLTEIYYHLSFDETSRSISSLSQREEEQ